MNKSDIKDIEAIISYEFKNKMLLQQAFMFATPEEETNPNTSEILRTIGKRVINYSLTKILMEYYGSFDKKNLFRALTGNDKINDLINALYSKDLFTRNILILGLDRYITCDNNNAYSDLERRLFEALIGAITLDTRWDNEIIDESLKFLLDMDYYIDNGFESLDNHYISLIYVYSQSCNAPAKYRIGSYTDDAENLFYTSTLEIPGVSAFFNARGNTKQEAKMASAKKAYNFLLENDMINIAEDNKLAEIDKDNAKDQLEQLAKSGYCPMPEISVSETLDNFIGSVLLIDYDREFIAEGETEQEAMNNAAVKALEFLKEQED